MTISSNIDKHSSYEILRPDDWSSPVIFSSPHSGQNYPDGFVKASRLDPLGLRRSEDAFVDEMFITAPVYGAPLLRAHFPRVYVDANREPYELDPEMFDSPLPTYVNTTSPRVAAGLGTMARVVTSGEEVYSEKLRFKDAEKAIQANYFPYHEALKGLLNEAKARFGCYLLIDCHSMPSIGGPMDRDPGFNRVDFILGDRHGTSCTSSVTNEVEQSLKAMKYIVTRNNPYAGGFTTGHYGKPRENHHTLQVEINRALYMNEFLIDYSEGFYPLKKNLEKLIQAITKISPESLKKHEFHPYS
jgi:N-formylglutamate amidohydrolase